ncbi:Uncharacterized protein QTN25_000511 [Entamoeba marina]
MLLLLTLLSLCFAESGYICSDPIAPQDSMKPTTVLTFEGDLTDTSVNSTWSCLSGVTATKQPGLNYKIRATEDMYIVASTCFSQTNFDTRIIIASTCSDGTLTSCISTNEGDTLTENCGGGRSRAISYVEAGVDYYIMVAGVTASDVGIFKLSISKYTVLENYDCSSAVGVSVPSLQDGTTVGATKFTANFTGDGYKTVRGVWYYFIASKEIIFLDTCNSFTSIASELFVFDDLMGDTQCGDAVPILHNKLGCGQFYARIGSDQFTIGRRYYVFLTSWADSDDYEDLGQYQLHLNDKAGDNYKCTGAVGLTSFPFAVNYSMGLYPQTVSPCDSSEKKWVCISHHSEGTYGFDTQVELYAGDCDICTDKALNNCGDDGYLEAFLKQENLLYSFYAKDNANNEECSVAHEVSLDEDVTNYIESIDTNSFSLITTGCNEISQKGAWYLIENNQREDQTISVKGTVMSSEYRIRIEEYTSCSPSSCVTTHNAADIDIYVPTIGNATLTSPSSRYIFITAYAVDTSISEPYGPFIVSIDLISTNAGIDKDHAVEITTDTFTTVALLRPVNAIIPACTDLRNSNRQIYAYWFKFKPSDDEEFIIDTCTTESIIDFMLEIDTVDGSGNLKCKTSMLDDESCSNPTIQTTLDEETYYILVMNDAYSTQNTGTFRMNIYVDEDVDYSSCDDPYELDYDDLPLTSYGYVTRARHSRNNCYGESDGLLGHWYKFKAKKTALLYSYTDDSSTFPTQISYFDKCDFESDTSVPKTCLRGETSQTSPRGLRGTSVMYKVKKGDTVLVYIGTTTNKEKGIYKISFEVTEVTDSDSSSDKNLALGLATWLVFGFITIGVALVGAISFGLLTLRKRRRAASYSNL